MAKEYIIANCLGVENVQAAIEEKASEIPEWEVHSITPAGLTTHRHPLDPKQALAIMQFLVLFHREIQGD